MFLIVKKIFALFSRKEKTNVFWLICLMILSSIINVFGIALVFPFMNLILDSKAIFTSKFFLLYRLFGFQNEHTFLIFLGVTLFSFIILGNIFSFLVAWVTTRFSYAKNCFFSCKLLSNYLAQPYEYFFGQNSSELIKNIVSEVNGVISYIILPFMQIIGQSVMVFVLFLLLLLVNPVACLLAIFVYGFVYAGIYFFVRKKIKIFTDEVVDNRTLMFKYANEALCGIKDMKILGRESALLTQFFSISNKSANYQSDLVIATQIPRYLLEIVTFGILMLFLLYFLITGKDMRDIIPLLSLYVFSAYRVMPGLQCIFSSFATMKANSQSLDVVLRDLKLPVKINAKEIILSKIRFEKEICLHGVSYAYPNSKKLFSNLELTIKKNITVGLVGETGAGKTTLVDIILGLLLPQEGCLQIDDVIINEDNLHQWQNNIGYVPQHIYLSDDTIASNIALGIPKEKIDYTAVKYAAKLADLSNFIEKSLPAGYETIVGDRGIRLSGGQRQRIGIARALYHDPDVLVLDEATSALDTLTEDNILKAIKNIVHQKTIIMVAHRLTTIQECNKVFFLKKGEIVDVGKYEDLIIRNDDFKKMARRK